ncbi:endonuclease domain-containing protein [Kitasatospora sp. NPDC004745]|uniref:endonuclease domain-containing protein n=1 Tax=Kitasatospora sp. NPDC004745 TaxID=3364019 RepID=UPI00369CE250
MRRTHTSCYHTGYSLSCAEYDDLLRLARGCCKICREPTATLSIDHDHGLGAWAVRGLLCQRCNQHMKLAEHGQRPMTAAMRRYVANAWHRRQATSAAKAGRVRPKRVCPACGRETSVYPNGSLHRHWSRATVTHDVICPGVEPSQRPPTPVEHEGP